MKIAAAPAQVRKPSPRTFATFVTSSGLNAVQIAIGMERRRTQFIVAPVMDTSTALETFDLKADPTIISAAIDTIRSLLGSLTDAADRGMLCDFAITKGSELLRQPSMR
jgi:hypothetical protein